MSVSEQITRLQTAKTNLKDAFNTMGVSIPDDAKIDTYYTYVSQVNNAKETITLDDGQSNFATLNSGDGVNLSELLAIDGDTHINRTDNTNWGYWLYNDVATQSYGTTASGTSYKTITPGTSTQYFSLSSGYNASDKYITISSVNTGVKQSTSLVPTSSNSMSTSNCNIKFQCTANSCKYYASYISGSSTTTGTLSAGSTITSSYSSTYKGCCLTLFQNVSVGTFSGTLTITEPVYLSLTSSYATLSITVSNVRSVVATIINSSTTASTTYKPYLQVLAY